MSGMSRLSRIVEPVRSGGRKLADRLLKPMLPGATLRERVVACMGALVGIALTGLISGWIVGRGPHIPMIVAPMGASAVLLFAVPASPLAQPWAIIGGNTLSALVGVTAAHVIPDQAMAIGVGVSAAIAVMSLTRCLHPPGGAAALTALIGGPAITSSGFLFPFVPVGLNSLILVGLGVVFHRLARRQYPHVPAPAPANPHGTADLPAPLRVGFRAEDIDAALLSLDETLDIDRADLDRLLREIEYRALVRAHGALTCADIMSRDVVTIAHHEPVARARELLFKHDVRVLPVLDAAGRLAGMIGLRDVTLRADGDVAQAMSAGRIAGPDDPAATLVPALTDGRLHAVVVTSPDRRVLGIVTQTDLLASLARTATAQALPAPGAGERSNLERPNLLRRA